MTASFGPARIRRVALLMLTALVMLTALLALPGCSDDDGGEADAGIDAPFVPFDSSVRPDGARDCTTDEECVDGVVCTRDVCDPRGYCRNPIDLAVCDDEIFCNGTELCDLELGCVPGPRETCNDEDVCTVDRCDEESRMCEHSARDLDQDGDPDFFCAGGGDCDDTDPTRHSNYPEVCGDGIDNDCDSQTDEATCGRGENDTCEDALDVSRGGTFVVNTDGLAVDYPLGCSPAPRPGSRRGDFVLTFELDEPRDVLLRASGMSTRTGLSLRTACGEAPSELECRYGLASTLRRRALAAGTYFVIVSADEVGEVAVQVELTAPTTAPPNETCATALDLGEGGTFTASMVDVADDVDLACQPESAGDLVYSLTTTAEHDVRVIASTATGENVAWALLPTCEDPSTALRCSYGPQPAGVLHQVPAGTYFLVIDGASNREVDVTFSVELLDPTPPLGGDRCATAIPLQLGVETAGTLAGMEDDLATSCGYQFRDVAYSFTLEERRDVTIQVDGEGRTLNASIRTACDDAESEVRCVRGAPVRRRLYDLAPGTYYVVVESLNATAFTLLATAGAPITPTPVSGNEACATAYPLPASGGVFIGDTAPMLDDLQTRSCGDLARSRDAVYRLDLTTPQRVIASTEGSSFDTVLHVHSGSCNSGNESLCDDDSGEGSASFLDRIFEAGTHYFVVDGRGMVSSGEYVFSVQITNP